MTAQEQIDGIIGQVARIREAANLFVGQELCNAGIEGILPAHGSILYFLFQQNEPVAMTEIVERVGRVKSTVTGIVKTLHKNGYVKKFRSLEDGRVILVQLTDKGRSMRSEFENISGRLQEKVYGDMSRKDREILARLLVRVRTNLEN